MGGAARKTSGYTPPATVEVAMLGDLLDRVRPLVSERSARLRAMKLHLSGARELVCEPTVAIVGARKSSTEGLRRAARLARELVAANVVVVSGLAEGIDTAAHTSAIASGGRTIAVIGTPLDVAYPAFNAPLQEEIYGRHLLISPFGYGAPIRASNFPERNKVMAAIADVTVIVEASDTSGSLHQAAECNGLARPLFIAKSVVDNRALTWPKRFLSSPTAHILEQTADILAVLPCRR